MDNLVDAGTRELGRSGLSVGPLAFGCWRFTHDHVRDARTTLDTALECGMHLVDTADVYGLDWGGAGFGACEALLGRVLADAPELRDRIVLATKGGIHPPVPYDSSADHLRRACEASLHRLEVDVVDLYQVHRPDLFAHPEAVAEALLALRDEGKIRAVGISNHTPSQHDTMRAFLGDALATTQPEYSAVELAPLRDGTFDRCLRDGVTPIAWSPLAGGRIASGTDVRPELLAVLDDLAARESVTRAAVAIAFTLAHPSRPVSVVGAQQPAHLRAATDALRVHLDRADCYRIVVASEGRPLP
jgi:predicted oxidoreductase